MSEQPPGRHVDLPACISFLDIGREELEKDGRTEELRTTPLFTWPVKCSIELLRVNGSSQPTIELRNYALLGHETDLSLRGRPSSVVQKPVFLNVNAPWSAFICGSQGSGKSYTLSCILENCLLKSSPISNMSQTLAGIIFHYDPHAMDSACEAAFLCSDLPVTVLTSPSNFWNRQTLYSKLDRNGSKIKVFPLLLRDKDLNTQRMLRLMAVSEKDGGLPLYMEVIISTLKTMAVEAKGAPGFNYQAFKTRVENAGFTVDQRRPLDLRLGLLETFLHSKSKGKEKGPAEDLFGAEPGSLTIVDLTDPFVDPASACVLFDICLALFLEGNTSSGYIFALDEAHKFMNASAASEILIDSIVTLIREQRHKGARIVISTQEPTISTRLLDLCSMTFAHRFTSPDWLSALKKHIAGAAMETHQGAARSLFEQIIELGVGESILFAPAAMLDVIDDEIKKLGSGRVKFKTRKRLTADGGRSVLAERI